VEPQGAMERRSRSCSCRANHPLDAFGVATGIGVIAGRMRLDGGVGCRVSDDYGDSRVSTESARRSEAAHQWWS
jgi:hypothetical protein